MSKLTKDIIYFIFTGWIIIAILPANEWGWKFWVTAVFLTLLPSILGWNNDCKD
jgi:hypothetical protein